MNDDRTNRWRVIVVASLVAIAMGCACEKKDAGKTAVVDAETAATEDAGEAKSPDDIGEQAATNEKEDRVLRSYALDVDGDFRAKVDGKQVPDAALKELNHGRRDVFEQVLERHDIRPVDAPKSISTDRVEVGLGGENGLAIAVKVVDAAGKTVGEAEHAVPYSKFGAELVANLDHTFERALVEALEAGGPATSSSGDAGASSR